MSVSEISSNFVWVILSTPSQLNPGLVKYNDKDLIDNNLNMY